MARGNIRAPKAGDHLTEGFIGKLTGEVNRLSQFGGGVDLLSVGGGVYVRRRLPPGSRIFKTLGPLFRGVGGTGEANGEPMKFDTDTELWTVETGQSRTLHADWFNGYLFADELVEAVQKHGRWFAQGGGHHFVIAELTEDLLSAGQATADVVIKSLDGLSTLTKSITVHDILVSGITVPAGEAIGASFWHRSGGWIATHAACEFGGTGSA